MVKVSRTVPAPVDLGLDVIGVPEGADVQLDLRLESVLEGVVVSGTVRVPLAGECVRCLDSITEALETEFAELFVHPGSEGDEETHWIEDDAVDLDPVVRDAVVLALPLQPVCEPDCPGLCSRCGARLADDPGHGHAEVDPRWAALGQLAGSERDTQDR